MSYTNIVFPEKVKLFDIGITNSTSKIILEFIVKSLQKSIKNYYIVTPNPEMIVESFKNIGFKKALNNAEIALCDGIGLLIASRILGKSLYQKTTGVWLMENLCKVISDYPINVGFIGGGPFVADNVAKCLKQKYPGLKVSFVGEEWNEMANSKWQMANGKKSKIKSKEPSSMRHEPYAISNPSIDVLFVAFGHPKQELWMMENLDKTKVRVMIGVGGAFDQIVNPTLRPPKILESWGLGWFYRLLRQPWRIKRQLSLLKFIWIVLQNRIKPL